jgi:hypothetical protein
MADEKLVTPGGALDKLAKLLAAENIMVEHRPIKTAYFDIKNRVLALPMWKEMTETLYHMLVLHEVGHALETPADGWRGAIEKIAEENDSQRVGRTFQGYLNVVEDARIERKIKTKFPGSRKDFIDGYDWLHQQDFFNVKNDDVNDLSLIDRINLYFKLGTRMRIKFTDEEREFVRRAEQTITFDDAVKLSEDLLAYAKIKKEEEDQRDVSTRMDNEEDGEGEESDDFNDESDDSDEGEPGDEANDSDDSDEEENEDGDDSEGSSSGKEGGKTDPLDGPAEAKTDTAMNDRMEELLDASLSNREFRYLYYPKDLTHEEFVVGYKELLKLVDRDISCSIKPAVIQSYRTHLLNKFRIENSSAINYMVKEFEMKKAAQAYSRTKQSKTGVIDTNKIHSYKFNDDVFRRLNIVPNGKNHGLVVILDMSGSMQSNYRGAMDQLICLTMFCRRVGIPHRIYGFTSTMSEIAGISHENHDRTAKKNRLREGIANRLGKDFVCPDNEFDLVELFNEGMSLKDFNTMVGSLLLSASRYIFNDVDDFSVKNGYDSPYRLMNGLFRPGYDMTYFKLGDTPLNDALLVSRDLIKKFRKEKNIQIMNFVCITDGESNCPQYYKMENGRYFHSPVNSYAGNRTNVTRIFIDEESKMQTTINFPDQSDITGMYARIVRESQNATFVGFYIVGGQYDVRHVTYRYAKNGEAEKFQEQFKKNKAAVVPKMLNFDEFYIIQGGKNLQAQQAKFDEAKDLKKGQLARAFISAQNKRGTSRAVLGRFIEKIAV